MGKQMNAVYGDYSPTNIDLAIQKKLVIMESPYAGDITKNISYAHSCIRDCILRNEAPIASHLLYTQDGILRDHNHEERWLGITCGWAWYKAADLIAVYTNFGISSGMKRGIELAQRLKKPIEERYLENFTF